LNKVRNKSNFLILVIAIVMGAIAAFLARSFIQGQSQVASPTTRTIVVAAAPIDVGVVVLEEHLSELSWSSATLPEGAFGSKQEFLSGGRRFTLVPIARNEPVLSSKVADSGHGGLLSALLDKNMRAVTVRVDDVSGVAGFILPGSRVDVAMIRTETNGGTGAPSSTSSNIILQNIKVLATDQVTGVTVEKAAQVARAVTLEVTSEDAQKVLIAEKVGKLSLILRQSGGSNSEARRITERDLSNFPLEPAKAEAQEVVAPVMPSKNSTVIIVRGAKPEEYSVKNGN
jgi:pilus assembly protein CpaB